MLAGKPSPSPNYHLTEIINPNTPRLALRSPGRGNRGFLCSFLDRLLGVGWGKPVHLSNQLLTARIVPRAEPASELLS